MMVPTDMVSTIRLALVASVLMSLTSAAPIALHPKNPHYFLFGGKAVALITSGEHYGAVLNADFDYRRYLAALGAEKLNYTRLFGGTYVEVPSQSFGILRNTLAPAPERYVAPWARSQSPGYAGGGNKFNLEQWNPQFFERLRDFLSEAAKRNIVVELTLFSSHYSEAQWKMSAFHPANNINGTNAIDWKKLQTAENGNILKYQEQYTRKLVREVNAFDNVIFEIQNEPWSDRPVLADVVNPYLQPPARNQYPNSVDIADPLSLAWQSRVAEWITTEERSLPNRHLLAQNYCNFGSSVRTLLPGVSVVNFHYTYPEAVLWNYGMDKAISYDETGFLGREDDRYRREAWNFMLSGGGVFNNLDYSFTPGHEDGRDTAPNGPGGGSPVLRHQLGILAEFLNSLPLVDLRPDWNTVKHAAGVKVRALSYSGHEYAFYLDGNGPTEVTFTLPAGDYVGSWTDTKTGGREVIERFRHAGGDKTLRTPGFQNGISLRLARVGA
ncbi:MAG: hypothetical protein JO182_02105 [Acidobacteriaceae bacterium]|nr:hypothetical protein [Acidobacteriaceae bacterium]